MILEEQFSAVNHTLFAGARTCLQIGGVSLGITAQQMNIQLDTDHEIFAVPSSICDIEIELEWKRSLPPVRGNKLFDSGAVWSLYDNDGHFVFDFISQSFGDEPYKRLFIDKGFSHGKMFLARECFPDPLHVYALEYPLDELIVTNWLARGRGCEVHGCGLVDSEKGGYLFIGHSGAGKSTTTHLWNSSRNVRILSDDRIIIRQERSQFFMYGTPWHGEAGYASPQKTALRKIFILQHGECNEIIPLSPANAVAELFTRCFLPFHDREALSSTLSYLHELVRSMPCYLFRALPNFSAVEEIIAFDD